MSFIVAEIGVNWNGDFELAKQMICAAKKAGCNAVKFQAYQENMVKGHSEYDRLVSSNITKDNVKVINELAKSANIEWFCTPMYPEAVDFLKPFVKRFKIREFDGRPLLENKTSKLLDRVFSTGKEIMISCEKSPHGIKYYGQPNMKWLYCVPKYPCPVEDLDFTKIQDYDGFSNHTPHIIAPLAAAVLGAKIIEIHITSDKTNNYIDNNVSFDYDELGELIRLIRLSEKIKIK